MRVSNSTKYRWIENFKQSQLAYLMLKTDTTITKAKRNEIGKLEGERYRYDTGTVTGTCGRDGSSNLKAMNVLGIQVRAGTERRGGRRRGRQGGRERMEEIGGEGRGEELVRGARERW